MKTKPDEDTLTDILTEIVQKYPPEISTHDNHRMAFLELITRCPEIIPYEEFLLIYTPGKNVWQMTDEILKPRRRQRERGLSKDNKILLLTDKVLNNPEPIFEDYGVNIPERTFYRLLKTANNLRIHGKPVDEYFSDRSDKERICIAETLGSIYMTNILFRTELYKRYHDKAKTVKKIPELEQYYSDAQKLVTMSKGGKQIIGNSIERDIQEFRDYLTNNQISRKPDKEFYDVKRFRYIAYLVTKIGTLFNQAPGTATHKITKKRKAVNSTFSIDRYLDELMSQPRDTHSVLSVDLPSLYCEGEAIIQ